MRRLVCPLVSSQWQKKGEKIKASIGEGAWGIFLFANLAQGVNSRVNIKRTIWDERVWLSWTQIYEGIRHRHGHKGGVEPGLSDQFFMCWLICMGTYYLDESDLDAAPGGGGGGGHFALHTLPPTNMSWSKVGLHTKVAHPRRVDIFIFKLIFVLNIQAYRHRLNLSRTRHSSLEGKTRAWRAHWQHSNKALKLKRKKLFEKIFPPLMLSKHH